MRENPIVKVVSHIWRHPANRGGRLNALWKAVAWQIYKRIVRRSWVLNLAPNLKLRCYPDSKAASLLIYCNGLPDYDEMQFMHHYLRQGDGFLDIGANIGTYTLLAASLVGAAGHVDAFEPGPVALARLRENVALNDLGCVTIHPEAVGAVTGVIQFVSDQDVLNRIKSAATAGQTTGVSCVRLDDVLQDRLYAMGKMDIEGAEPLAFLGAERLVAAKNPPVWLLEINGKLRDYGFAESDFAHWLFQNGYDLALYNADRRTLEKTKEPWRVRDNVLAIARNRWQKITKRLSETNLA